MGREFTNSFQAPSLEVLPVCDTHFGTQFSVVPFPIADVGHIDSRCGLSCGTLKTCDQMYPWYFHMCIGYEYARSWRRVSTTRFPGKPPSIFPSRPAVPVLTLTAWQNANPDQGDWGDILISVGRVSDTVLPAPFSMLENSARISQLGLYM